MKKKGWDASGVRAHPFFSLFIYMKASFLLVMIPFMQVSAKAWSQDRFTFNYEQVSPGKIFTEMQKESRYRFFYVYSDIKKLGKVSVHAANASLAEVLDKMLPAGFSYKVMDSTLVIISSGGDMRAPVTVSGRVTDSSGNALAGVTVAVKGGAKGVITDANGRYTIVVSEDAVLEFSYIGYVTVEVAVKGRSSVEVTMRPSAAGLNEVVVVGYGTQSKRFVTGSVASVNVKQLASQPNTNVTQALRGRVAGVEFMDNGRPGQSGSILIRGQRSITASNDPLIIVDGAFYNGDLADINPNDVASIDVLKDASAAAIYGSRAANGVILITTKAGTSKKPVIRFNTYYGISGWSYKMKLYSPQRYLQRRLDYRAQNQPNDPVVPVRDLLTSIEQQQYDSGRTVNPWDAISQPAGQQSYYLSVSGRGDRVNYFVSGGYTNEQGLIYGDWSKRISERINLDARITDWLHAGVNSQYTRRHGPGVVASVLNAYWLSPYSKLYYDKAKTDPVMPTPSGDDLISNPMFGALMYKNEVISNNLFANAYAIVDFPFIKGLSYRLNYSPNIRWNHDYSFQPIYQRNGVNNTGSGTKDNRNDLDWQLENILTYTRDIGQHHVDLTLVYGRNHSYWEETEVDGRGFVNDANGWNNLGIAQTVTTETHAEQRDGVSSMARLNYRFRNKYLVTLTARRDGSSVFGKDKKYGIFPSAALAWIMSEEPFAKASWIDMLKWRVSYGAVGNQAVSPYQSLDRSASAQYVFGSTTYTAIYPDPSSMPNAGLGWETTYSMNAALDFSFLDGRIGGTAEYYNMHTKGLLLARSLPVMTGFESTVVNLGETSNEGVDLTLNTVNVKTPSVEWGSSLVFSTNRNRIVHLYYADNNGDGKEDNDVGNRWFIGRPIGVIYDYVFDGIYQQGDKMPDGYQAGWVRVKDMNGDGQITPDDRRVLGQTQPKYRWGLTNYVTYRGFTLSFFINAMEGWKSEFNLLDVSTYTGNSFPGRSVNFLDAGYWTPQNKSNTRPGLTYTDPLGRGYYLSRDFVRIQDATLAYDFPSSLTSRLKISSLRVYVSGRNLATFTSWLGPDPESGYNNINNLYPSARTVIAGINLSF